MTTQAIVAEIEKLSRFEQADVYKSLYALLFSSPNKLSYYLKELEKLNSLAPLTTHIAVASALRLMRNTEAVRGIYAEPASFI